MDNQLCFIYRGYLLFCGEYQIYFMKCNEKSVYSQVGSMSENADVFIARYKNKFGIYRKK